MYVFSVFLKIITIYFFPNVLNHFFLVFNVCTYGPSCLKNYSYCIIVLETTAITLLRITRAYSCDDSDVILSKIVTTAMLEVYHVAAV